MMLLKKEVLKTDLDMYKFYLEMAVKLATFMFAITGAVVSYSMAHYDSIQRLALMIPLVMNAGVAVFFLASIVPAKALDDVHTAISREIGSRPAYDLRALWHLLLLFGILYAIIAVGILGIMFGVDPGTAALPTRALTV